MTTLAGIAGKGWCVIGAESKASDDSGSFVMMPTPKVFINNGVLIAGCGSVRGLNVMEYDFDSPTLDEDIRVESYLTRQFIPTMRKTYIEAGLEMKEYGDVATMENGLLIGIAGRLFSIGSDYSWDQSAKGLYSYGSGGPYAMGAMTSHNAHKCKTPEDAVEIITIAIKAAIECDVYSGGKVSTFVQFDR
jgi:20S proteasome alpha/beta subunit